MEGSSTSQQAAASGGQQQGKEAEMFSIERSEFDRLQMQLIELRTANYQLKEQQSKSSAELSKVQQTLQSQSRDLERANKAIQRSKKAKEFSSLVEENESIQLKLERQEEDFRLQNQTLMGELSKICEEKDALEAELERAKKGGGVQGGADSGGQVTHLKAENAALLKSVQSLKDQLKEIAHRQSDECDSASPQPAAAIPPERVMELELKLSTEVEEKKLLQERLAELQVSARKDQEDLRTELEKWTEKAKKKQDSLVQLQEEKERQFYENRSAFNEMVRSKDHEIQTLQNTLEQTQKQLDARNESREMSQDAARQLEALKNSNEEWELRSTVLTQDKEVLVKEKVGLQDLLSELGRELQQAKADLGEEKKTSQDLHAQLEEAKLSQEQLADQVVSSSEEKHKMTVELETITKLAEKRKSLLDKMSIKEQESASERQKKAEDLENKFKDEISRLEELLQQEQSRNWKLSEAVEELPALQQRCQDESKRSEVMAESVKRLEATLEEEKEQGQAKMAETEALHQQQQKLFEEKLKGVECELEEGRERVKELEGEMEDKQESVRIVERKSQGLLKDLKRQLQQMQKREDKLQEQLAEMRGVQAVELQREVSGEGISTHSRESSLSSMRGMIKMADTPDGTGSFPNPSLCNSETQELLARVAELQQEKWALEEKVHHLENTGSALAEDVIQKSEIIKTYFMETKADHSPHVKRTSSIADKLSPMKLMPNWGQRSKEDTLEEINRKMQRALEEALMKNIHLQQNLETLTTSLEQAGSSPQASPAAATQPEPSKVPSPDS